MLTQKGQNIRVSISTVGDSILEIMESTGILPELQINETKIKINAPINWVEVKGSLKAGDGRHKLLLDCKT